MLQTAGNGGSKLLIFVPRAARGPNLSQTMSREGNTHLLINSPVTGIAGPKIALWSQPSTSVQVTGKTPFIHRCVTVRLAFTHAGHELIAAGMLIMAGGGNGTPLDL